jgi:hypothetical protein
MQLRCVKRNYLIAYRKNCVKKVSRDFWKSLEISDYTDMKHIEKLWKSA